MSHLETSKRDVLQENLVVDKLISRVKELEDENKGLNGQHQQFLDKQEKEKKDLESII